MADNAYSSQSISGYNASPPPDDDSTGSGNQVAWGKHIAKIGDPVKNLSEAIDTAATTLGAASLNNGAGQANTFGGTIGYTSSELTISGGSITPTATNHTVDTEADAGTDDLATLATGSVNDRAVVALRAANGSRVVTVKNASGNINLMNNTDVVLDLEVPLVLQRNLTNWEEISRPTQDLETTATPTFAGVSLGNEALTTYDEGTWTPVIAGSVTPGTQTYTTQTGVYTQIGNMMHVHFEILLSAFDAATNGNMTVTGLPTAAKGSPSLQYSGTVGQYSLIDLDVVGAYHQIILTLPSAQTTINIQEAGDDVALNNITEADFSATTRINGSISYQV